VSPTRVVSGPQGPINTQTPSNGPSPEGQPASGVVAPVAVPPLPPELVVPPLPPELVVPPLPPELVVPPLPPELAAEPFDPLVVSAAVTCCTLVDRQQEANVSGPKIQEERTKRTANRERQIIV